MKRLLLSAAAAGVVLAASAAQAATYVAYDDFDIVGGGIPASSFTFGHTSGAFAGAVTAFSTFQTNCGGDPNLACAREGEVVVSKAKTYVAGVYDPPGTNWWAEDYLGLHADSAGNMPVIQFTAAVDGDYTFDGRFQAQDQYPTGVDLMAYVGATSQFSTSLYGGAYDFSFAKTLAAGDKVSFLMGPGGNWAYDTTGFKLAVTGPDVVSGVPEPTSWAMMILGAGLAGSALRGARRRRVLA